jgi:hypothetical protein
MAEDALTDEDDEERPYFTLALRIFHPSIDPDEITTKLDIAPHFSCKAGEPALTPAGTPLHRIRKETYWYYSESEGDKNFPEKIERVIADIAPHRDFFHRIVADGGRIEFYLCLLGSVNIGNTLSLPLLARLVDLKIELSIEVFPKMNRY